MIHDYSRYTGNDYFKYTVNYEHEPMDFRDSTHMLTHSLFNGHFLGKPGSAGFSLGSHIRGFEPKSFYKPDALPVTQPPASKC